MHFDIRFLGNTKKYKFDISELDKDAWLGVAEDIIATKISPRAVLDDETHAKVIVRDNIAKMAIGFRSKNGFTVLTLSLNEFGCKKEDYNGIISQIMQLCMKNKYGLDYIQALEEDNHLSI